MTCWLLQRSLAVCALVCAAVVITVDATTVTPTPAAEPPRPPLRHDYKQTFKKPFYYNNTIPFFDTFDNTILSADYIRLTSVPGLTGSIWEKNPNPHPEWEVEFSFISSGRGNVGGDGLAFWYTQDRGQSGPVLGSKDKWHGLGILFDTYDHAANRNSPYVYGIMNNGSLEFAPNKDPEKHKIGSCWRNYRNPSGPVFVRVSYYNKHLQVATDTVQKGKSYIPCFDASNIELPKGYYFGFSAKAGDIPDDHDIFSFETYEVNPQKITEHPLRPHEEEKIKQGGAFNVSEEARKHIEEVQHKVEEVRHKEQQLREAQFDDTPHMVRSVQETQFRIIESLNALHSKLETLGAPAKPIEVPADINARLSSISQSISLSMTQIKALNDVVTGLATQVSQIGSSNSNPNLADHAKIAELQNTLKEISARFDMMNSGSPVPSQSGDHVATIVTILPYVLLFFAVQLVLVWLAGWKLKADGPKKFI